MDILTQALLGATAFSLVKDKEIGKKSLLIGACAGILPDLDGLLGPFFNDVQFLSIHRSVSHSILLALFLSVLLGLIFRKYFKSESSNLTWMWAFFLAIFTHPLLDMFTTYGTKIFSPMNGYMFSLNSIHVFEPFYTGILLIGVVTLLIKSGSIRNRRRIASMAILASCIYLAWTVTSKVHAYYHFVGEIERQGIEHEKLMISPTPLNSILWHGIVKTENGYYFGTYSVFDSRAAIEFQFVKSEFQHVQTLQESKLASYYLDYTQDFPLIVDIGNGELDIFAVKYGPINYFGEPKFMMPLTVDIHDLGEDNMAISYRGNHKGPIANYRELFLRIKGI